MHKGICDPFVLSSENDYQLIGLQFIIYIF